MEGFPDNLSERRSRLEDRKTDLSVQRESLERAELALEWEERFQTTLERGGTASSPFPYDIDGVWRLAINESDNPYFAYETVVVKEELPEGVEPVRRTVSLKEIATGQCGFCGDVVPLLGRSQSVEVGMGDVGAKTEVAVVHCNKVQVQPVQDIRLPNGSERLADFTPHQRPTGLETNN
jgi:hypothetical protein